VGAVRGDCRCSCEPRRATWFPTFRFDLPAFRFWEVAEVQTALIIFFRWFRRLLARVRLQSDTGALLDCRRHGLLVNVLIGFQILFAEIKNVRRKDQSSPGRKQSFGK